MLPNFTGSMPFPTPPNLYGSGWALIRLIHQTSPGRGGGMFHNLVCWLKRGHTVDIHTVSVVGQTGGMLYELFVGGGGVRKI